MAIVTHIKVSNNAILSFWTTLNVLSNPNFRRTPYFGPNVQMPRFWTNAKNLLNHAKIL